MQIKFIGTDIRIINISKGELVKLIRQFIASNGLSKDCDEDFGPNGSHISAINPLDSYWKFWWKGTPQIADWKLLEAIPGKTRIETRFGLHKWYRIWTWGVLIILAALFAVCYELDSTIRLAKSSDEFLRIINYSTLNGILVAFIALAFLVFAAKSLTSSYSACLISFKENIQKNSPSYYETILQSNCLPSHTWEILIFIFSAFVLFICVYSKSFLNTGVLRMQIGAATALLLLLVLLGILYFCARNIDFSGRFTFIVVGVAVVLPFLIFYSLPYLNAYTGNFALLYEQITDAELQLQNNLPSQMSSLMKFKTAVGRYFLFAAFGNLVIISLGFGYILLLPRLLRGIISWKRDYGGGQNLIFARRGVVDFRSFSKEFYCSVFALWGLMSVVLYILIYTILCVLECTIFGDNYLFVGSVGKTFCGETKAIVLFFLAPLVSKPLADLLARLILLTYSIPLLLILHKLFKKRVRGYLRSLEERKKFILDCRDDNIGLHKEVIEIAEDLGVPSPDIVVVPSRLPMMGTKYIGFPYFRPYLVLSQGCLSFKKEELSGLLAHEIYHVKRHSLKWYLLNLLSEYTFFGSGFLAMTTNSYQHELDADRFAADWVAKNGSFYDFINALRIMNWGRSKAGGSASDLRLIAGGEIFDEEPDTKKESWIKRWKGTIDTLFEFYFSDKIFGYIHPPLEERIERIKAVAEGKFER